MTDHFDYSSLCGDTWALLGSAKLFLLVAIVIES